MLKRGVQEKVTVYFCGRCLRAGALKWPAPM